ncbi:MAG TPA: serine/threonine-protein kinase [Pirellulaceae bacterium]|nr:serine/threonine-protein kinase [Pirellulaceae bacterium]
MDESRVGPFALEERLGPAGCHVYRAIHVQQRRQVALKVLPVSLAANLHGRLLFGDEMALLKRLQDPHVVRCFGGNMDERQAYIAYELIGGESLSSLLARRGRLGWEQTVDFAVQIGQALQAAGEIELTHHDLTPDKILITSAGQAKVTDFRKEREKNPLCTSSQTRSLPRIAYQSPEQIRRAENITHKADLYMLGCLMFEMLTGRTPFLGNSADEVAEAHLSQMPPRVMTVALDAPVWLDALLSQLLEKDPARRPHTIDAVLLALEETKRNMASGAGVARHALAGISALKVPVDKQEVRRLVHGKRKSRDGDGDDAPLWERPWFLVLSLSLLVALLAGVLSIPFWPVSEDRLMARAEKLMASEDPSRWQQAREHYLEPLLERFPNGKHAERAQEHIDTMDMSLAEKRLANRLRLGRELSGEGQRLYAEAKKFEEFGDQATALERYQGIVTLVKPEGEDRPYVLLARRQIARLEETGAARTDSRGQFIEEKLAEVDELLTDKKRAQAEKILRSLQTMYGDNAELAPYMTGVEERLEKVAQQP